MMQDASTAFATGTENGWNISGRKNIYDISTNIYFVVSASTNRIDQIGSFLVRRELPGVSIDEIWDSIAMKATGSHDLVLENVPFQKADLVKYITPGNKERKAGYYIPACY